MQLDKFSDYALRILIALASYAPDKLAASTIAQMYGISESHLSKVATRLAKDGFVISERGRGGGLRLAMPVDQIRIGAVLRALKQQEPVAECFSANRSCTILPACGLRAPLAVAQDAFFAALDGYSLADVTRARSDLKALLSA